MKEFLTLAAAVTPIFVIVAAGLVLRRFNWLTEEADRSLLRICIHFLIPALILASILGNEKLRSLNNLVLPPIVGFCAATAGIGAAWIMSRWSGASQRDQRGTFALTAGLQNYLYYALPLIALLFDPGTVGVLFMHNLGVDAVLWTVGVAVLSGGGLARSWRGLLNAPIIALICAVSLNLLQIRSLWLQTILAPDSVILTTARTLGKCAIPLALILTGAIVADHLPEIRRQPSWRIIGTALVMRFGIAPVLYFAIARFLPCSIELKRVLVVQGAMPSAMFPILMTRRYGGDSRIAVQIVLATTIASLVMIPIWLRLAAIFMGL
jgi:hypothetical protein